MNTVIRKNNSNKKALPPTKVLGHIFLSIAKHFKNMNTNVSQKAQKQKFSLLNRQAFLDDLLQARPHDYQERNWFYHWASIVLSYPLQIISILAGSYVLYDIAAFIWQMEKGSISASAVFLVCMLLFFGIESLRRWLVNTTGYHFIATFKVENRKIIKGEWLTVKVYWLLFISVLLITSGTSGTYLYIKHHSPKAAVLSMEVATSPIESKIQHEKNSLTQLDKNIEQLLQSKKSELKDYKNYQVWEGKEFLLPEVKTRHANYDKQIAELQNQRKTHQNLIVRYETKLSKKEQATEQANEQILAVNHFSKEMYAGISAGIWLCFELVLVFMLAYTWLFKYGVKKEKLLESIDLKAKNFTTYGIRPSEYFETSPVFALPHVELSHLLENHKQTLNLKNTDFKAKKIEKSIGFDKWYEKEATDKHTESIQDKQQTNPEPQTIIKEIIREVPVIQEVIREVEVFRENSAQGYKMVCEHCGKEEIKKRPAKFCSNACRNKAWKASQM